MSDSKQRFYMTAVAEQSGDWMYVRSCTILRRLQGWAGDQYALVKIDPPVETRYCSQGDAPLTQVVITPHSLGTTLFPMNPDPLQLYVLELRNPISGGRVTQADVCMVAWCSLHTTRQSAEEEFQYFTMVRSGEIR